MPEINLTDEEKTKFKAYLKEMGFENEDPPALIKKLNDEAKASREAHDAAVKATKKLEADLKVLTDEKTTRDDAEKKRLADEDAKKKLEEDNKKTAAELIKDAEERFNAQLKERDIAHDKAIKDRDKELKARDARLLTSAVRSAAKEAGLIDLDLVGLLDLKGVKVEDGEPDMASIDEIIKKHVEEKPHLYDKTRTTETASGDQNRSTSYFDRISERPGASAQTAGTKGVDFATLNTDAAFEAAEQALRHQRV